MSTETHYLFDRILKALDIEELKLCPNKKSEALELILEYGNACRAENGVIHLKCCKKCDNKF